MIIVLRLNHRRVRDKRVSTHAGLVARAFGADKIIYTGDKDDSLLSSVTKVVKNWGGSFTAEHAKNYKKVITDYKKKGYLIVHLTMYGLSLDKEIIKIRKNKNVFIIIGGEKVPSDVYELADYNISVTSQPHSEIAALAMALDRYRKGKSVKFKERIKPSKKGKEFY